MANILEQVSTALTTVQNFTEGGKLNITVANPTVQVSAQQALEVARPYIIAVVVIVFIGTLLFLIGKKG